ncbi:hypothetical protein [uncultured Gammaproteobacteria bacterium]|nr:hypothetical protein [uncultured Gammaproteobacteria bacterium]
MCWKLGCLTNKVELVSVAGCLGYDVLENQAWGKIACWLFQLLVV